MKFSTIIQSGLIILMATASVRGQQDIEKIMREEQERLQKIQAQDQQQQKDIQDAYKFYEARISQEYQAYEAEQARIIRELEKEILKKWDEFRFDTKEEMVDYSADLNTRSSVNFKAGVVEVAVVADPKDPQAPARAKQELERKIKEVATQPAPDNKPLLQNQLQTSKGAPVTTQNAAQFAKETVQKAPIESKQYKAADGKEHVKYSVKVTLVPNHIQERAGQFKQNVQQQSQRFGVETAVSFAVMHTESYFNPRARSAVPAFGLMQLVPSSGARDAYIYVYQKDRLLKADYLYDPANNIELGCAYLSKIRKVYFKDITDDTKAYYCAICAYNTGPGNVARALTGTKSLSKTAEVVNANSAEWVYNKLLRDLPYDETKGYLKNVTERRQIYQAWQ